MKIVLDANIFIAALLGSRATLTIITSQHYIFYVPKIILEEIRKYKSFICGYSKQSSEEFDTNLNSLLVFINVLESIEYEPFMQESKVAMTRDVKDADYLACALAIRADFIWTNDKDFSTQHIILTKTTQQFIDEGKYSQTHQFIL